MAAKENLSRWRPGLYEVWYATTNHHPSGTGLWFRSTLPEPAQWAFAFAPDGPRFAARSRVDAVEVVEGRLAGTVRDSQGREMTWDLVYDPAPRASLPLPAALERVAGSFYLCPNLDVRASGVVTIDGTRLELHDEPLGQSHIWGRHHAGDWCWAHVHVRDGFVIEALQARPVRPRIPALPFVLAVIDGVEHRFVPPRARGRYAFPAWDLRCRDRTVRLRIRIEARREQFVQVTYHDPDRTPAWCTNTEVADAVVEISSGAAEEKIAVRGSAHVEFGSRTPRPGLAVVF